MRWVLLIWAMGTGCASESEPRECRRHLDDSGTPTAVDIVIRNQRAETLLLAKPCGGIAVHLESDRGWTSGASFCETCGQQFDGVDTTTCSICLGIGYLSIAPREQVVVRWPGALYEHASPAPECFAAEPSDAGCYARRIPLEGTIELRIEAITDAQCVAAEPDPSVCTCTPGPFGCDVTGTVDVEPSTVFREIFDMATAEASGTVSFTLE
jgi:hypothetical protein